MFDKEKSSEKEMKKKKEVNLSEKGRRKLIAGAVAVVLSFLLFFILVVIQSRIVNGQATTGVVVAITDVPKGVVLTEENMAQFFGMEYRLNDSLPAEVYYSGHELVGTVTTMDMYAKEVITPSHISKMDLYEGIKDPVELTIMLGDLGAGVGGSLRAGDLVDIKAVVPVKGEEVSDISVEYPAGMFDVPSVNFDATTGEILDSSSGLDNIYVDAATGEITSNPYMISDVTYGITGGYVLQPIAENVKVTCVYNSAGQTVEDVALLGESMVATVIQVVVPRSVQDTINLAIEEGVIRLSRVAPSNGENVTENVIDSVIPEVVATPEPTPTVEPTAEPIEEPLVEGENTEGEAEVGSEEEVSEAEVVGEAS